MKTPQAESAPILVTGATDKLARGSATVKELARPFPMARHLAEQLLKDRLALDKR